jgi:hypothetical protein
MSFDVETMRRWAHLVWDTVKNWSVQEWSYAATIFGACSIPVSAFLIWLQLKHQTKLARWANTQAFVELSSSFNLQLIHDEQMAKYWVQGASKYTSYDDVEKYRYISLVGWWLILQEDIWYQYKKRLLEKPVYQSWRKDLESFLEKQCPPDIWKEIQGNFQPEFCRCVNEIHMRLASAKKNKPQPQVSPGDPAKP